MQGYRMDWSTPCSRTDASCVSPCTYIYSELEGQGRPHDLDQSDLMESFILAWKDAVCVGVTGSLC